jgi:hypothetical protein
MKAWSENGDFLALLKADDEVAAKLSAKDLDQLFDLGYHLKHVDTIFQRVFGVVADEPKGKKPAKRKKAAAKGKKA